MKSDFFKALPFDVETIISNMVNAKTNAMLNRTCKRLSIFLPGDALVHIWYIFEDLGDSYNEEVTSPDFDDIAWKIPFKQ